MSNLKKSLIKKMAVLPSKDFDSAFFEKLKSEQSRPKVFSRWVTWAVSGLATASVLFITVNNYNTTQKHAFNHQEYVDSVLEIQDTFNEDLSDTNTNDLTVMTSDEI